MAVTKPLKLAAALGLSLVLAGCSGGGGLFGRAGGDGSPRAASPRTTGTGGLAGPRFEVPEGVIDAEDEFAVITDDTGRPQTLASLFGAADDPNVTVRVNRYLWRASLEVLSFLPVEAADPFGGVIVMGWGAAPGSGRQYRATVYIQDPALEARSLRVAVVTRGGAANRDTVRQIEDAILTRARQLRIQDRGL